MTNSHDLNGLIKLVRRAEWAEPFEDVLDEHFSGACDAFDLDGLEDLASILDADWVSTLWGCAFEDFMTREIGPQGRNIVEVYLKKRGFKEQAQAKRYMTGLRQSTMSLFEVSDIEPGQSMVLRDLIAGGDPVRVHETSATQTLGPWQKIAARLVPMGERTIIAGGMLPFSQDAAAALMTAMTAGNTTDEKAAIRDIVANEPGMFGAIPPVDASVLGRAAPLFTMAWLFDVLPKAFGEFPTVTNRDGDEFVFHKYHYPLAKGVRRDTVTVRLEGIEELSRRDETTWDWLGEAPDANGSSAGSGSNGEHPGFELEGPDLDLTTDDGRIVLGHVELEGRFLVLTTGSAPRAERATAMIEAALGDRLLKPQVRIEALDDFGIDAEDEDDLLADGGIPADVVTAMVHGFLDKQYRQILDEPVPALGNVSPRTAVTTPDGRSRVAEWLKYLETQAANPPTPCDPLASYDFSWMWEELGIKPLRR